MLKTVAKGTESTRKAVSWGAPLFAALAATALACPLSGCSSAVTGTSGDEGTVDMVKSKEVASSNPEIAKKSARLGGALGQSSEKKGKRPAK